MKNDIQREEKHVTTCYITFDFSLSFKEMSGKSYYNDLYDNPEYNFSKD